jgi:hypothetical protein
MTTAGERKVSVPTDIALSFRAVSAEDLPRVFALESAGYPDDEAASLKSLTYRCENANSYFLVAETALAGKPTIVGFVCGTLTSERKLTHDTMFTHNKDGTSRSFLVGFVSAHYSATQAATCASTAFALTPT